jgi:hypothetical protein
VPVSTSVLADGDVDSAWFRSAAPMSGRLPAGSGLVVPLWTKWVSARGDRRFSQAARAYIVELVDGEPLVADLTGERSHGRRVGRCYVDGPRRRRSPDQVRAGATGPPSPQQHEGCRFPTIAGRRRRRLLGVVLERVLVLAAEAQRRLAMLNHLHPYGSSSSSGSGSRPSGSAQSRPVTVIKLQSSIATPSTMRAAHRPDDVSGARILPK